MRLQLEDEAYSVAAQNPSLILFRNFLIIESVPKRVHIGVIARRSTLSIRDVMTAETHRQMIDSRYNAVLIAFADFKRIRMGKLGKIKYFAFSVFGVELQEGVFLVV